MSGVTKRVLWVAALALQGCSGESELEQGDVDLRLGSSEQALAVSARSGWPLAGADPGASGFNATEHTLTPKRVGKLEPLWRFDSERAGTRVAPIHATPVVDARGSAFVGDVAGTFFAIDRDGDLLWSFTTEPPTALLSTLISAPAGPPAPHTPIIGAGALASRRPYVVFADMNGRVYARDVRSGEEIWTARDVEPHPLGGVTGNSLSIVGDTVLVGLASNEDTAFVLQAAGVPVECCSHSGGVLALDLETGNVRWQYRTIEQVQRLPSELAPFTLGPSGADVWSQPSYDEQTDTVYIGTGQGFSPGPDGHASVNSDSIIALDFHTGRARWARQLTADDIWLTGMPSPDPVTGRFIDADVSDSPKVYRLRDGRKVVGAGQKDGRYHVLDARTGEVIRSTQQLQPPNALGGFQSGGAIADELVFQHGTQRDEGTASCSEPSCLEGRVLALSKSGAHVRWQFAVRGSPLLGGLAVAAGVVYVQSPAEEPRPLEDPPRWALYALDADTGAVLRRLELEGRAVSSPVVSDGRVYVGVGNGALDYLGLDPQGGLLQLGLAR